MEDLKNKPEAYWKKKLTPEQYRISRLKETEPPFSGKYYHYKEKGMYKCAACGQPLFPSETKFESGTGWPSFWAPVSKENIEFKEDKNFLMTRTEAVCRKCGAHLGHVFDDGPKPTNKRYCINSLALEFEPKPSEKSSGVTLIEIVVSLAVIGVVFVGYFAALRTVTLTRQAKHQTLAAHLAGKKIEELKNTPFSSLPASGIIDDLLLVVLPSATSSFSVADYGSPQIKQATVTIRWQEASGQKTVELSTLLISEGL